MCESTCLWLKCGKELDEGMKFFSCIIVLNEVWEITALAWWKLLVTSDNNSWKKFSILTWRFRALEVAHQFNVLLDVVESFELSVITDDLHRLLDHLQKKRSVSNQGCLGVRAIMMIFTHIVEELQQRVGRQLSVVLDDLVISKDVDAVHLQQTCQNMHLNLSGVFHGLDIIRINICTT